MFDKICKVTALIILAFIAYTFYLYTSNTRYEAATRGLVLDRKTGELFAGYKEQ